MARDGSGAGWTDLSRCYSLFFDLSTGLAGERIDTTTNTELRNGQPLWIVKLALLANRFDLLTVKFGDITEHGLNNGHEGVTVIKLRHSFSFLVSSS